MNRVIVFTVAALVSLQLFALEWFVLKPAEMATASPAFFEVGFPAVGILTGSVQKSSGGSEGFCLYMQDGKMWNPCPAQLGGTMKVLVAGKFASRSKFYGLQSSVQGMKVINQFVHADNFQNVYAVKTFDTDNTEADMITMLPQSMEYKNGTLWLGHTKGKVLISTDEGKTWTSKTVTSDAQVQITSVHFSDAQKGWATGGFISSKWDFGKEYLTMEKKGGIWTTTDGGNSWTPVVTSLEIMPLEAARQSGTWFIRFYEKDNIKTEQNEGSTLEPETRLAYSKSTFSDFVEWSDTKYDIPVGNQKFGTFNVIGLGTAADESEVWIGGFIVQGLSGTPAAIYTKDGGTTWTKTDMPQGGMNMKLFNYQDSSHMYVAGAQKNILKYGDPNEDFTEQPDTEQPDNSTIQTDDPSADTAGGNDSSAGSDTAKSDTATTADSASEPDVDALMTQDEGCGCTLVF